MFQTGDVIVYENNGVYRVEEIGPLSFSLDKNMEYYTLRSLYNRDNTIVYIPVAYKGYLRKVITSIQAKEFLAMIENIDTPEVHYLRNPRLIEYYKDIMASHDIERYLTTLKEIQRKKELAVERKRKIGQIDLKYEQMILQILNQEFAYVLEKTPEQMMELLQKSFETYKKAAI